MERRRVPLPWWRFSDVPTKGMPYAEQHKPASLVRAQGRHAEEGSRATGRRSAPSSPLGQQTAPTPAAGSRPQGPADGAAVGAWAPCSQEELQAGAGQRVKRQAGVLLSGTASRPLAGHVGLILTALGLPLGRGRADVQKPSFQLHLSGVRRCPDLTTWFVKLRTAIPAGCAWL